MAACSTAAPARTPPHLDYTPGPAVIVTEDTYHAGAFSVQYPRGWRVITPAAFSVPWVVFVTPDETALVALALVAQDTDVQPANTPAESLRRLEQMLVLETGVQVHAALVAPHDSWMTYLPVFERMVASVR